MKLFNVGLPRVLLEYFKNNNDMERKGEQQNIVIQFAFLLRQ